MKSQKPHHIIVVVRYMYLASVPLLVGAGQTLFSIIFSEPPAPGMSIWDRILSTPVGQFATTYPLVFWVAFGACGITLFAGFLLDFFFAHLFEEGKDIIPAPTLMKVIDVRASMLKLGDPTAANFTYITKPIDGAYQDLVTHISHALQLHGTASTYLITGVANSGKTRLAYEVMKKLLSAWYLTICQPDLTLPSFEEMRNKSIVILVDDLQDYLPTLAYNETGRVQAIDSRSHRLQSYILGVRSVAKECILIVTCREEERNLANIHFNWLFNQARIISLPVFSGDQYDETSILQLFSEHGARYIDEWDGTLGSIVLGLNVKVGQYYELVINRDPCAIVLHALKLLSSITVRRFTQERLRQVAVKVFNQPDFRQDQHWDHAVQHL